MLANGYTVMWQKIYTHQGMSHIKQRRMLSLTYKKSVNLLKLCLFLEEKDKIWMILLNIHTHMYINSDFI